MELKVQVQGRIKRPLERVFNAVYDPGELSAYFTTGGASGPLVEGTTVTWDFADFPGAFPVKVTQVEPNRRIVLEWEGGAGYDTRVEMEFESLGKDDTLVKISESGWRVSQKDLDRSYGNCMGWTQMLCCCKVWVEHGINLREGFFDTRTGKPPGAE